MKVPALVLALGVSLASSALAQEMVPVLRPTLDPFLVASDDPLTKAVLRTQVADSKSGGVVSAVLHRGDKRSIHVDYQGSGTPAEGLALPASAVSNGPKPCAPGEQLRDAVADLPAAKAAGSKGFKRPAQRALAADQLLSVMKEMRKGSDKSATDKAWERRAEKRRR